MWRLMVLAGLVAALGGQAAEIAFLSSRSSLPRTYVINLDGTGLRGLDTGPGSERPADRAELRQRLPARGGACVSPDGRRRVTVEGVGPQASRLVLTEADGSCRVLTSGGYLSSDPVFSPDGRRVAFSSRRDSTAQVCTINTDGTDARILPSRHALCFAPAFSPDGLQLAYAAMKQGMDEGAVVCVANADGSGEREVPKVPAGPRSIGWAADGRRLVVSCASFGGDLFAVQDDGTGLRQICDTPVGEGPFSWSPDGEWLMTSQGRGSPCSWLCRMRADGSERAMLPSHGCFSTYPVFLPDGLRVLFAQFCGAPAGLCLQDRDGSGHAYVVRLPEEPLEVERLALSPDGRRAAYVTGWGSQPGKLYVVDLPAGMPRLLSGQLRYPLCAPSFCPDGRRLVFTATVEGNEDLYVVGADGQGLTRLTTAAGPDRAPAWSPDGTQIAFVATGGGHPQVALVGASGGSVTTLARPDVAAIGELAWSPEGAKLAFAAGREQARRIYVVARTGGECRAISDGPGDDSWPQWRPQPRASSQ